jgi:hypothetical protein
MCWRGRIRSLNDPGFPILDFVLAATNSGPMIEETRKNLKVNRDVSVSEVADLSILRQAQREWESNKRKVSCEENS